MAAHAFSIATDDRLRSLLGTISRLRASAVDASAGAVQIAREVLESVHGRAVVLSVQPDRINGMRLVTTITRDQELKGGPALEVARMAGTTAAARVAGSLFGSGRPIGAIDLYLTKRPARLDDFTSLVRYMGEQIGGLIAVERLEHESRWLAAQVASVKSEIARRKVTSRAIAILVSQHRIGQAEAARQLEEHGQKLGKSVADVAAAVVMSAKLGSPAPDRRRRPQPTASSTRGPRR